MRWRQLAATCRRDGAARGHDGHVGERLGQVAQLLAARGVDHPRRRGPRRWRRRTAARAAPRPRRGARVHEAVEQPERAEEEGALVAGQAVGVSGSGGRTPSCAEVALHDADRREHPRVSRRQEAEGGYEQRGGVGQRRDRRPARTSRRASLRTAASRRSRRARPSNRRRRPASPCASARRTARSSATQQLSFECTKWRGSSRISQMPWSGRRHAAHHEVGDPARNSAVVDSLSSPPARPKRYPASRS